MSGICVLGYCPVSLSVMSDCEGCPYFCPDQQSDESEE